MIFPFFFFSPFLIDFHDFKENISIWIAAEPFRSNYRPQLLPRNRRSSRCWKNIIVLLLTSCKHFPFVEFIPHTPYIYFHSAIFRLLLFLLGIFDILGMYAVSKSVSISCGFVHLFLSEKTHKSIKFCIFV